MNEHIDFLIDQFLAHSQESGQSSDISKTLSLGLVVDNDDPLEEGRLRIFCPSFNDDPKKILHVPFSAYASPVSGVISQPKYTRGHIPGSDVSTGPLHYGFWAIPEIGAHALVACINGDPRRRVWLGCMPSHQETNSMGQGRYRHQARNVYGPLTSSGHSVQPTFGKFTEAFNGDRSSSEWKTRGADYQIASLKENPVAGKPYDPDDSYANISANESDSWVRSVLGEHGYDWTGYKNLGSFLASRVYSWTTPGFHTIQMDDRAFNSRIRVRTTGGNQIILDDTNERMYFSTSGGKSWLEMDAAGNIDIFTERRFSVHAEKDINFSADGSIRFKAGEYISMFAGTPTVTQDELDDPLNTGEIRIHSDNDFHLTVGNELHAKVHDITKMEFGDPLDNTGEVSINLAAGISIGSEADVSIGVKGDFNISADDVKFSAGGHPTTIDELTSFLDDYVDTYNSHTHVNAGANLKPSDPLDVADSISVSIEEHETLIAPWTNRVPEHEPWPRTLKQDASDTQNSLNDGYINNVGWVDQFDNVTTGGRFNVGKVEGDETIDRGPYWRR